jgi:hypothetical protein
MYVKDISVSLVMEDGMTNMWKEVLAVHLKAGLLPRNSSTGNEENHKQHRLVTRQSNPAPSEYEGVLRPLHTNARWKLTLQTQKEGERLHVRIKYDHMLLRTKDHMTQGSCPMSLSSDSFLTKHSGISTYES